MSIDARAAGGARLLAAGLSCALAVLSCAADERSSRGGLLIVIESDLSIPKDIDHISLDVTAREHSLLHVYEQIGAGHLLIPAQFKLSAAERSVVTARALAFRDGVPRIERSAVTQIPQTHIGVLRLPLKYLCDDTAQDDGSSTCGEGQTCILGSCRTAELPTNSLPTIEPAAGSGQLVDSVTAADGGRAGCFDVRACMLAAVNVQLEPDRCTFPLPEATDPARLNIAVVLPPGDVGICDDRACYVALDKDEDWSVEDAHVQPPQGFCSRLLEHPFEVRMSTTCAAKTTRVPLCGDWSPVTTPIESPVGVACSESNERSCGKCGTQTRTCRDGRWSAFGPCNDEGECVPGVERSCGSGGRQRCNDHCTWDDACTDQRCQPAGTATQRCGNCLTGTQTRSCDPNTGKWSDYSACVGAGECAPNETRDCGVRGKQTCGDDCQWGAACAGQSCVPEGSTMRPCGNCLSGMQTRSCDANSGAWSDWSACSGAAPCAPSQTRSCGSGGVQICGDDCQWESACEGQRCLPAGAASRSCGNCNLGQQVRSCDPNTGQWSEWTRCSGGGACSPRQTQTCGSNGTQVCGDNCQWEQQCREQTCLPVGSDTQRCGNCNLGTQTRTCNTDTAEWTSWSACKGGGVCSPHATQPCGEGDVQECTDMCTWGACGGCSGPTTQPCGRCGTQTRTCYAGAWSPWSACSIPAPPGGVAGGYEFNIASEGWQYTAFYDGDTDMPVPETRLFSYDVGWNGDNQEGAPLDLDTDPQKGAGRVLLSEGPISLSAPSGQVRVDVVSPSLDDTSPFQNHTGIRFAVLYPRLTESIGSVSAQAVLKVQKCDNKIAYVRPVDAAGNPVKCTITRDAWSVCEFRIVPTDAQKITQLQLRFYFTSGGTYDEAFLVDSIRAQ